MEVLVASTPATGHLNPLLMVAHGLIEEKHEVTFLTGSVLRSRVEAVGASFRSFPAGADLDLRKLDEAVPELKNIEPGPERSRVAMQRIFVDTLPAQFAGLQQAVRDLRPDIIVADDMFFGVLPMLLGPGAKRIPVVLCGTSILHSKRDDSAPVFLGLPPATTQTERDDYAVIAKEYDSVVNQPVTRQPIRC